MIMFISSSEIPRKAEIRSRPASGEILKLCHERMSVALPLGQPGTAFDVGEWVTHQMLRFCQILRFQHGEIWR